MRSVEVMSDDVLTAKQRQFCTEYLVDRNASAAAKRAGYKTSGMGSQLMKHPEVRKELTRREQKLYENHELTVAEIVGRLAEVMRFDIIDLCDENGQINLSDLRELPKEARACIKEMDVRASTDSEGNQRMTAKIKMYSKLEAADMLMRYFGGYKPEVLQQLVQLDYARLEKRSDIKEDDPLIKALADLTAPTDATKDGGENG